MLPLSLLLEPVIRKQRSCVLRLVLCDTGTVGRIQTISCPLLCLHSRQWSRCPSFTADSGAIALPSQKTVEPLHCLHSRQWNHCPAFTADSGAIALPSQQTVEPLNCLHSRQWSHCTAFTAGSLAHALPSQQEV